jgi:hypothetical protein
LSEERDEVILKKQKQPGIGKRDDIQSISIRLNLLEAPMTQADTTYLVALGEMIFRVQEECPKSALAAVKAKILCDNTRPSLVKQLQSGKANLLVMDENRLEFFAGEMAGTYQAEPSAELIENFKRILPPKKYRDRA